jgi:hypothetical protein
MSDIDAVSTARGDRLTQVFLNDLTRMAGIVTVITQPFAQESLRAALRLPDWIPIVIALGVSGLLALYKMIIIIRDAEARECAICVPIVMLVVFAAYATSNNVVYYAKEGLVQPMSAEQVAALKDERDLLEKQLRNSEQAITPLRRTLNLPAPVETKPTSALPPASAWARLFGVPWAEAQDRRPEPRDRARPQDVERQRLQEDLKKFDMEQRQLKGKLESIKPETSNPKEQQQRPLIKSW